MAAPAFVPPTLPSLAQPETVPAYEGPDAGLIVLGRELESSYADEQRHMSDDDGKLEEAVAQSSAISRRMLAIPARSAAGLAVKLRAYHLTQSGGAPEDLAAEAGALDEHLLASAVNDATALSAGTAHLPHAELDAPIVEAWVKHQALFERFETLSFDMERIQTTAALEAERPEALRIRKGELFDDDRLMRDANLSLDGTAYYSALAVDMMRDATFDDVAEMRRATEIVAAHDAWTHECLKRHRESGLVAAANEHEDVGSEMNRLGDVIRDAPALSLKGLGIKAAWALQHTGQGEQDLTAVLQEVERFAHRHSYASRVRDIDGLEQRAMGGLPAADWELHRLFIKWLRAMHERDMFAEQCRAASEEHGVPSLQVGTLEILKETAETAATAYRNGMLKTAAASEQGVRVKAAVYAWKKKEEGCVDETLALNIADDLARLGPPPVMMSGREQHAAMGRSTGLEALGRDYVAAYDMFKHLDALSEAAEGDDWVRINQAIGHVLHVEMPEVAQRGADMAPGTFGDIIAQLVFVLSDVDQVIADDTPVGSLKRLEEIEERIRRRVELMMPMLERQAGVTAAALGGGHYFPTRTSADLERAA